MMLSMKELTLKMKKKYNLCGMHRYYFDIQARTRGGGGRRSCTTPPPVPHGHPIDRIKTTGSKKIFLIYEIICIVI